MFMKRIFFCKVLLFAVVALLAVSCSKDDDTAKSVDKRVTVLLPDDASIDRWATDKQNLESVMAKYGFDATFYTAPETPAGAEQQVEQLKKAINDGVKYIVLTAIDYKKINESKLLEKNRDVKVVCHDRLVLDNPYVAYFSTADTKAIGYIQAMCLLSYFHSSGASSMTLELLEGPETDLNAKDYYDGAMGLLQDYIEDGQLVVKSGKLSYNQVKAASWDIAAGKSAMQDRLESYETGKCPDLVLAANDNLAQGAIDALTEAGITKMPIITGQDNTDMAKENILNDKQAMTIDKNLNDMAYNTAMIVNGLISGFPVQSSRSITVGNVEIPVIYCQITTKVKDSY